jgi:hypothetical protein
VVTTSPNSSAEAWERHETERNGTCWVRSWSGGSVEAWSTGEWCLLDAEGQTTSIQRAESMTLHAAMEAADLAIAELERKG